MEVGEEEEEEEERKKMMEDSGKELSPWPLAAKGNKKQGLVSPGGTECPGVRARSRPGFWA